MTGGSWVSVYRRLFSVVDNLQEVFHGEAKYRSLHKTTLHSGPIGLTVVGSLRAERLTSSLFFAGRRHGELKEKTVKRTQHLWVRSYTFTHLRALPPSIYWKLVGLKRSRGYTSVYREKQDTMHKVSQPLHFLFHFIIIVFIYIIYNGI